MSSAHYIDSKETVKTTGIANFRERIIYSTLSGKPLRITDIRSSSDFPGLTDYETNFLKLIELISNGSRIEVNETGTTLHYEPGVIIGGKKLTHECHRGRAIGYYLEALLCLAPFAKRATEITLEGITNDNVDVSVDTFRVCTIKLLKHFGLEEGVDLKILRRGAPPEGGGAVQFTCPVVKQLHPITLVDEGQIRRVRGLAYSTRVSPHTPARMIDPARGLLNKFLPDVFIYSDHYKGVESGLSPGFGLSLLAETTTGCVVAAEGYAESGKGGQLPEEIGEYAAKLLIEEIARGGVVDSYHQHLILLFMTVCSEDVSQAKLGKLTTKAIDCLRDLKLFFGIVFKLEPDAGTKTVAVKAMGVGMANVARAAK